MKPDGTFVLTFMLVTVVVLPCALTQIDILRDILDDASDNDGRSSNGTLKLNDILEAGKNVGGELIDDLPDDVKKVVGDLGDQVLDERMANVNQEMNDIVDDLENYFNKAGNDLGLKNLPFNVPDLLSRVSGISGGRLQQNVQFFLGILDNLFRSGNLDETTKGADDLLDILSDLDVFTESALTTANLPDSVSLLDLVSQFLYQNRFTLSEILNINEAIDDDVAMDILKKALNDTGITLTETELSALLQTAREAVKVVRDYTGKNASTPFSSEDVGELFEVFRQNAMSTDLEGVVRCSLIRLTLEESLQDEVRNESDTSHTNVILDSAMTFMGCPNNDKVLTRILNDLSNTSLVTKGTGFIRSYLRKRLAESILKTQVQILINTTLAVREKVEGFVESVRVLIKNTFDGSELTPVRAMMEKWVDKLETTLQRFVFRDEKLGNTFTQVSTLWVPPTPATNGSSTVFTVPTDEMLFPSTDISENSFNRIPSFGNAFDIFDQNVLSDIVGGALQRIQNVNQSMTKTVSMIGKYIENRTTTYRKNAMNVVQKFLTYPLPNLVLTQSVNLLQNWQALESLLRQIPKISESEIRNVRALVDILTSSPFFRQLSDQINRVDTSNNTDNKGSHGDAQRDILNMFSDGKPREIPSVDNVFELLKNLLSQMSSSSGNGENSKGKVNEDDSVHSETDEAVNNTAPEVQALVAGPTNSVIQKFVVPNPGSALIILGQVLFQNVLQKLMEVIEIDPMTVVSGLINVAAQNDSIISRVVPAQTLKTIADTVTPVLQVTDAVMALTQIFSTSYKTSQRCANERAAVAFGLTNFEPWALTFIDAMGKPMTGVLQGNTYLVGNFDQCVAISGRTSSGYVIGGSFVRYRFFIDLPVPSMAGEVPYQRSGPPFINWQLCLPSGCSDQDVASIGRELGNRLSMKMTESEIITKRQPWKDSLFIASVIVFLVLGLLCLVGTITDVMIQKSESRKKAEDTMTGKAEYQCPGSELLSQKLQETPTNPSQMCCSTSVQASTQLYKPNLCTRFLLAFSLYSNIPNVMRSKHSPGDITCLHGIRVISISWVILGHTLVFAPQFGNLSTLVDMSLTWPNNAIFNAPFAVDTFFVLGGCLVAYIFLRAAKKAGRIKPKDMALYYLHRYLRITPLFGLAMLLYAGITPYLEYGPFQTTLPDRDTDCSEVWWWNLLYISNLRNDMKSCMSWTWYLPTDMQFYAIAPLVLIPLAYGYRVIGLLVAFLQLACHFVMTTVLQEKYNGTFFKNGLDYFIYVYIKPYTRCGPYAIGLVLGYLLFSSKCKVRLSKVVSFIGWLLAFGISLTLVYITYDNFKDGGLASLSWNDEASNSFEIVSRPLWAVCMSWVIFACATDHGGVVNSFLSWGAWIPLSRLTFGTYLSHVMVMHYFNNNARSLAYFTANYMVERYLAVFVLSYAISFVLSMLIETPVRNLIKPAKKSPAPNVEGKKNQPNSNTFEPVLSTITTESGDCQNLKLSKPAVFSIQNDYTSFLGTGAKSGNDEDSALSSSIRSSEPSQRGALTDTESGHHYYSDLSRSTSSSEMSEGYPALKESRVTFSDDPRREANGSLQKVSNTPQTGSDPEQSRPTLNGEPEHGEIKTGEDNHGFQVDDAVTLKAPPEEGAREAKNSNIGGDNAVAIRM